MDWGSLESPLNPTPAFFVEAPDGKRDWPEIDRQATFRKLLRAAAPRVMAEANANAGKRNPRLALKEGIRGGVFDLTVKWRHPLIAWVEFKGYTKAGRAGALSDKQIEWGNRMVELGYPVACFFSPYSALDWLREQGFPVAETRDAA